MASMGGRMMLVMVLAMTWLSMGSSAQLHINVGACWRKVDDCVQKNVNESRTNPEFDPRSPSFNKWKFLCCPLIRRTAMADNRCFCSIGPVLHQTLQGDILTKNLIFCNAFDSLASFDAACSASNSTHKPVKPPSTSPPVLTPTPNPTKAPRVSPQAPRVSPPRGLTPAPAPAKAPKISPPGSISNHTRSPRGSPSGLTPTPAKAPIISPPGSISNHTRSPRTSPPGSTASPPMKTPTASSPSSTPTPSASEAPAMSPRGEKDSGLCWDKIGMCLQKHVAQRKTKPEFDSASKSFNVTEFLCCSHIQQAAKTDKRCFCTVQDEIRANPSNGTAILGILNACNVADSLASLGAFCSGSAPSPTATPPTVPPPGLAPVPQPANTTPVSPAPGTAPINQTATAESPKNASTKISMMGSFSGIFILLTYFLFY